MIKYNKNRIRKTQARKLLIVFLVFIATLMFVTQMVMAQEGSGDPVPHKENACPGVGATNVPFVYHDYYHLCVTSGQTPLYTVTGESGPSPGLTFFKIGGDWIPACPEGYERVDIHNVCEGRYDPGFNCIQSGHYPIDNYAGGECQFHAPGVVTCLGWDSSREASGYPDYSNPNYTTVSCN